jgi:hypothetical protein
MEILEIINIDPNFGMLFRVLLSKNFEYVWKYSKIRIDKAHYLEPIIRAVINHIE